MKKLILLTLMIPVLIATTSCGSKSKKKSKNAPKVETCDQGNIEACDEAKVTVLCETTQILDPKTNSCVAKDLKAEEEKKKLAAEKKKLEADKKKQEESKTTDTKTADTKTQITLDPAIVSVPAAAKTAKYYCKTVATEGNQEVCKSLKTFIDYCKDSNAPADIKKTVSVLTTETGTTRTDVCNEASESLQNRISLILDSGHGLTNLYPLAGMLKLQKLNLNNNAASDLTPLNTLRALNELHMENNKVASVELLNIKTQLSKGFFLFNNPVCQDTYANDWVLTACDR